MKKFLLVLLILVVVIGTFGIAYGAKSNVTLTFGAHQAGVPISGVDQKIAKVFEKETGIKIDFQIVPDAQWRDLLKVKLASGEAPDIFLVDADPFSLNDRIHPAENCIDLSKEKFVSRMDPVFLPSVSYKGKVYGLSIFPGVKIWIYYYDKDLFKKLNLEPPKNYAEFKKVCQTIKDAGVTPVYECLANGWHQVLPLFEIGATYEKAHPKLYDELNTNKIQVTEVPGLLRSLTELKEFADLGFYNKDFMTANYDDGFKVMADGKAAMFMAGLGWREQLDQLYPGKGKNIGFFIMPWDDNQILNVNPAGNARFGNKHSKHVKEILQYFRFLTRHDILQMRQDLDDQTLVLNWPEVPSRFPADIQALFKNSKQGTVMQYGVKYIDSQWMDVGKDIEAMYAGAFTPKQVVNNIQKRRIEQATLQKDPYWVKK
jgi:raffinose/stachyose/melibiose transport system substrate-binding protein